jgi:formate C-acetyltransferase
MGWLTYDQRIEQLRQTKLEQTRIKQQTLWDTGYYDSDDKGLVPPPAGFEYQPVPNHPSGGFFGPKACGENFRRLLETHPTYIDPCSSLAGGWMVLFRNLRKVHWNPDFDYGHLHAEQKRYDLICGIGGSQHFNIDFTIGLALGWQGLLDKIRDCRRRSGADKKDFYDAHEDIVLGMQSWIGRNARAAREAAGLQNDPVLRQNLQDMARINARLVTEAPATFREAVQWVSWFFMAAVMYNGSGAVGQIDTLLLPYYEHDRAAGTLTDEEAVFHLACMLLKDNQYFQLGGPDIHGKDVTNPVSFLMLEAGHRLKIPNAISIRVHDGLDPQLFRKAIEYLFADKTGSPAWMGDKGLNEGFVKNGYPIELARQRVKSGCHWCALPGREYTLNDVVKVNFAAVFDVALRAMMGDASAAPSVAGLWDHFERHLRRAVAVLAEGIDFHLEHQHKVFPELVLNLLCHGPIEKGLDVSHGGVVYYNMCVDGAGLATVADSLAAIEQRVEKETRLTWQELMLHLDRDFQGAEDIRLMLRNIPRYGSGRSRADHYAQKISRTFTGIVKEKPTAQGFNMIPGLFSWANTIGFGRAVGATPNGRHAHAPISHGASPDPGFVGAGAPTAMATAVASVQCGYGNTAPMQLDMDPGIGFDRGGLEQVGAIIKGHFDLGGTMINMNVLSKQQVLEAHRDPSKYPDLVVRVTGFSAYFASLSPEFRQLVVDRIIAEGGGE